MILLIFRWTAEQKLKRGLSHILSICYRTSASSFSSTLLRSWSYGTLIEFGFPLLSSHNLIAHALLADLNVLITCRDSRSFMLDRTQFLIDYIRLGAKRGKNSLTHTDLHNTLISPITVDSYSVFNLTSTQTHGFVLLRKKSIWKVGLKMC